MSKVSVGLRGWRFDETAIFTPDGEFRPLDEMARDDRERLLRLGTLVERPCDACYLIHGEAEKARCRQATVVYGEPGAEVVCCDEHEREFVYWFHEAGGSDHRGERTLRDSFHEWFATGGRAPDGYAGLDHVETDPEELPAPPGPGAGDEVRRRIDLRSQREALRDDDATDEAESADRPP
jgi:hypothetical protein